VVGLLGRHRLDGPGGGGGGGGDSGELQHQLKADFTAAMMDLLVAWMAPWFAVLALLNVFD
jgi:hypothetical protein